MDHRGGEEDKKGQLEKIKPVGQLSLGTDDKIIPEKEMKEQKGKSPRLCTEILA